MSSVVYYPPSSALAPSRPTPASLLATRLIEHLLLASCSCRLIGAACDAVTLSSWRDDAADDATVAATLVLLT